MPKVKTRNSISRRFKLTKTGKVTHRAAFARHLRRNKSRAQLRRLSQTTEVSPTWKQKLKRVLTR